jgi:redox-sensitive bicupin YhaK (pirin superfamily)
MRTVKNKHKAIDVTSGGLVTYRPMPGPDLNYLDPFLFLNHHGTQLFPPQNRGLPFGPHPHRGIETVTFILKGDLVHKDNVGFESRISAGGIQWMTAGSGLLHAETSSKEFKANGGEINILQLWINLPAKFKMVTPTYVGLQKSEIPAIDLDGGKVTVNLISGDWNGKKGPVKSLTNVRLSTIDFKETGKLSVDTDPKLTILLYVVEGSFTINGIKVKARELVEFGDEGSGIEMEAETESTIIFGQALPFNEPVVAQGPFVMNTEEEIMEAYNDYRSGKFGSWND